MQCVAARGRGRIRDVPQIGLKFRKDGADPVSYRLNPLLAAAAVPPIPEALSWVEGRSFPADRPLLDLAQAVPGYPPAHDLVEDLARRVGEPETARYTEVEGIAALRLALAERTAALYGGAVEAGQVFVTAGSNQAFCLALLALAGAGDEVILPVPYFFNHRMWLDMLGVRAVLLPFRADRGGVPDPAEAEASITARTRALVLVTPNNPTGAVCPPDVLDAFYDLARRHGLALVVDETYRDFCPGEGPPHGLFRRPDWPEVLVHLYSFSKVYSLAGYRVGAAVARPALLEQVFKAMDCAAICAPRIGQEAALFGLRRLDAWRREKRALMRGRAEALREALRREDLRYRPVSIGAFFAYLRHPFAGAASATVARRLATEHNLLCLPGSMFGPGQDDFLRLAFAGLGAERMPEVAGRLVASQG